MAYRDIEFLNPLDLFPGGNEAAPQWDAMLQERMRSGEGRPLQRLEQLNALSDGLSDEPCLRMEYDRFSPALRDRMKKWRKS